LGRGDQQIKPLRDAPVGDHADVQHSQRPGLRRHHPPHTKPHPAPLHEAMRQIGVRPDQCVYVGDDERDMVAGRAAGMATVAARYGYLGAGAVVERWPADAVINSPAELLNILETA